MSDFIFGSLVINTLIGIGVGLIPLFFAASKEKLKLGFHSLLFCAGAGFLLSFIGAVPTAAYCVYYIKKTEREQAGD